MTSEYAVKLESLANRVVSESLEDGTRVLSFQDGRFLKFEIRITGLLARISMIGVDAVPARLPHDTLMTWKTREHLLMACRSFCAFFGLDVKEEHHEI